MIRTASEKERAEIKRIWKVAFANDDGGYTDYYFSRLFNPQKTLVNEVDGKIVSVMELRAHSIELAGKRLGCFMIVGVATIPSEQHKGYMKQLMQRALEIADRQVLLTLIQEYNKGLYEPFGFVPTYYNRIYTIKRKDIPTYSYQGITDNLNYDDLERMYQQFTSNFQGYYVLKKDRFPNYVEQLNYEQGTIHSLYIDNEIKGYYTAYLKGGTIIIDEIMYANGKALLMMLAHAATRASNIVLKVSRKENLTKLLPNAHTTVQQNTLVRINDVDLFKRCYHLTDESIDSIWQKKPLYLNEVD